ncbi:MAG: hypothetical protein ACK41Y_02945 [Paracoccus hibiscisoli]|uniref:hypothetical protein n=1 Tax=Paracoccus hibiscisoli TaxID=2023261 RepID=UPI00391B731E
MIDIEDDLSRLRSLLLLLQMASGDLIKEQRDAMYMGLDKAIVDLSDIADRLAAMRAEAA